MVSLPLPLSEKGVFHPKAVLLMFPMRAQEEGVDQVGEEQALPSQAACLQPKHTLGCRNDLGPEEN